MTYEIKNRDLWLGWRTRRLPKPAHVLSKNPYYFALCLVSLANWIVLVQTVRDGEATWYVCGPQNSGKDMSNSLYQKQRLSSFLTCGDRYFIYGKIYPFRQRSTWNAQLQKLYMLPPTMSLISFLNSKYEMSVVSLTDSMVHLISKHAAMLYVAMCQHDWG